MSNARDKANIPSLNFSSTGIDDNATSTAITIDSSERVGIGITSPTSPLMVQSNETYPIHAKGANAKAILVETTDGETGISLIKLKNSAHEYNIENGRRANTLTFYGNPGGERMCIDSSGNVGIGTSSPTDILNINKSDATSYDASSVQAGGARLSIFNRNNTLSDTFADIHFKCHSTSSGEARIGMELPSISNSELFFVTENSSTLAERMRIASSGKVGIGTSSPGYPLQINSSAQTTLLHLVSTAGTFSAITFANTGSNDSISIGAENDDIKLRTDDGVIKFFTNENSEKMRIDSTGNVGISGIPDSGRKLHIEGNDTTVGITLKDTAGSQYGINSDGGSLIFKSDSDNAERMRIDSSGSVFFNTNGNAVSASQPGASFTLDNTGSNAGKVSLQLGTPVTGGDTMLQFINSNGQVGYISVSGTSTAYNTSSDYRLKENVSYDFDATTRLKQLKPARFNFITDADTTVDGFLAHEVSSVVPEAISGEKDAVDEEGNPEYQGIDQSKLVPLLVKTIQELEARITTLEANNP